MFGIVIHGGAGVLRGHHDLKAYRKGLGSALSKGYGSLAEGGSALDAVIAAVFDMEESGAFNAGVGCSLTVDGRAEVDAGIMNGNDLSAGAVASLDSVRHPVLAAKRVMEDTDHVLLVGPGAMAFLETYGIRSDPELVSPVKLEKLSELRQKWLAGEGRFAKNRIVYDRGARHGTVGAVAIDSKGMISSAVSTGGYWLKLSGRVGDSPIPGAGFWADSRFGGAVATGTGEYAIRTTLCRYAVDLLARQECAQSAADSAIAEITRRFGNGTMGIIVLDKKGDAGFSYNTEGMGRAAFFRGWEKPLVQVFPEDK